MKEIILPLTIKDLQIQAYEYVHDLEVYLTQSKLLGLFNPPIDHFAIKATNSQSYEKLVESARQISNKISYVYLDQRRLATAELTVPIEFVKLGQTSYLEIMEPRPNAAASLIDFFEHAEIYSQDLGKIKSILALEQVVHQEYKNPNHEVVVLEINKAKQEIKFTNKHLSQIIKDQEERGEVTLLIDLTKTA